MRQKRAKQYRKQMQLLRTTFKFKTPIQCLVDDSTILEATNTSYDLIKGVNSVVQTETKYFITQCCIQHLYDSNNQLAIDLAKRMEKRRCGHKETLSSLECIKSITNVDGENKYRYLVVTQEERLRNSLRNVAGVPLCFLYRSVLVMEPLNKVTKRVVEAVERMKLTQGLNSVDAGKRKQLEEENNDDSNDKPKIKRVKKVKGINPLAMKKKQKKVIQTSNKMINEGEENEQDGKKKRRRRKHNKLHTNMNIEDESASASADADADGNKIANANNNKNEKVENESTKFEIPKESTDE
jgi:U3 small nucleolar RNA-associated protein 23